MKETTKVEVVKAINSLLTAGWNTKRIAEQLSSRESFGLEGAGFTETKELADEICRTKNIEIRADNKRRQRAMNELVDEWAGSERGRATLVAHGLGRFAK